MDEKQVNKWLRGRFSQIGWVLLGYAAIMEVLTTAVLAASDAGRALWAYGTGRFDGVLDMGAAAGNFWGYILAIAAGAVILYSWKGGEYWKRELAVRERPMKAGVFFALVCLCIGAQVVNNLWIGLLETIENQFGRSLMPMLEGISGGADTLSMFLYMGIFAPLSEEILFRGYVLRSLRPFGKRFAVFGSAFLFGLFHGNLMQLPLAILVGLLLGYVAVEYSIYWSIALHGFNNLILGDLLTRLLNLLPVLMANVIDGGIFLLCTVASLVLLIVKRHEIRAYRSSEWMDRRCLKWFFLNSGIITLTVLTAVQMAMFLAV